MHSGCRGSGVTHLKGGRLPGVGEACSALSEGPGLDSELLAHCISARIEGLLDAVGPEPLPPNIVLILTDDQRWDTLDFMPQLQRELLARGIQFPEAFVTTTACCPSRASLFSGRYAHNHGILINSQLLLGGHRFDHEDILPAWLRDAGYQTALFGKYLNHAYTLGQTKPDAWTTWQIFTGLTPRYLGYQLNIDGSWISKGSADEDYSTDYLARETIRFIRENRNRPFFVVYSPFAPHEPALPAARHAGLFTELEPHRPPNFREDDLSQKPLWLRFIQRSLPGPEVADALRIRQLESLLAVDEAVGAISRTLDELGLTDNTVVLFLSDNGMHWGAHWWLSKWTAYEESIRVPFVLRYPRRFPVAGTSDALVLNIDVAPTLAAASGASPPAMDGQDILPVVQGSIEGRDDFLIENFTSFIVDPHKAVRSRRWKYIITPAAGTEELYDLEVDPYELENLAGRPEYEDVKAALTERLGELQGASGGGAR